MIRVGVISPEPTPYRTPLYDQIARLPDIELEVLYAARTVAKRSWTVELAHPATFLTGIVLPLSRLVHHDYPVSPQIWRILSRRRFDCLVVAGWSLFASQAAVVWARSHRIPYVVTSESHLLGERPAWIQLLKRLVIPQVVGPAAGMLVTGSAARDAVIAFGADPRTIRVFANTVDTHSLASVANQLRATRSAVRANLGIGGDEIAVVSVGRLDPQKGMDLLIEAVAAASTPMRVVLAGAGPAEAELAGLARKRGVDVTFAGFRQGHALTEVYLAADVFALLSRVEPWGVVVNEAAACGLPLVLSDSVGAARDLVEEGENGLIVPAGEIEPVAGALDMLAGDASLRARFGARSQAIAMQWGYDESIEAFADAVRDAVRR